MDKKALKKEYKERELKVFRENLPMIEVDFLPLFDFLDSELSENDCQHDFSLLESYCKQKGLNFSVLVEWFKEQGGLRTRNMKHYRGVSSTKCGIVQKWKK